MKLNRTNIATRKATIVFMLVVEILFPFYSAFAALTVKNCCHKYSMTVKHCCCDMQEKENSTQSCDSFFNMKGVHSLNNCGCIHKSLASSNEVTPQKNFELSKEMSVNYFVDIFNPISHSFSLQNIFSLDKYHSPPIYLVTSSILI